jgi:Ner family transcriptional regulator
MSKSLIHSPTEDWTQIEVLSAVKARGSSFPKLAEANGYDNNRALYHVFYRNNAPKAQKVIADFLGLSPKEIWPSRYQSSMTKCTSPAERPHVRVV